MSLHELNWLPHERALVWKNRRQVFLPKEYALLEFLARHPGRTFSRAQLLDQVWTMENPVDRTVDDHVFRLRKKLKQINGPFRIETVRGVGYRLTVPSPPESTSVSIDEQVEETLLGLWSRYAEHGRGDSLEILAGHQDVLGFRLLVSQRCFFHASRGNLRWFVETEDIPAKERMFYLCYFYQMILERPERTIRFLEEALSKNLLGGFHAEEMRWFTLIECLLDSGQSEEAERRLVVAKKRIGKDPDHCLRVSLRFTEAHARLLRGKLCKAEASLNRAEEMLDHRFRRESAMLHLYRGLLFAARGQEAAGKSLVMRDWEIMDATRMFLNRLHFLNRFGKLRARLGVLECLAVPLNRRRQELLEECEAPRYKDRMESVIRRLLSDISLTIPR
ncbi:winged helix-turn-helix domain-containing protein [Staphylospora marina]|uniref:winged helix-turn-helix domain-containing protein n=1 Tax=Staphylospora marina TaxID=2490858 RepID=UPI0024067736|nr:winged helix-turn-helix domain-containing protein [Staphylospora marina]